MKFPPSIFRYWLALNASAFDSAVHACAAFFGVAGAHALSAAVPALTVQQFAALFLIAFGRAVLAYLDAHPVAQALQPAVPAREFGGHCGPPFGGGPGTGDWKVARTGRQECLPYGPFRWSAGLRYGQFSNHLQRAGLGDRRSKPSRRAIH